MAKRAEMVETRRKKRRQQIFEGAVKVFAEKGFHAATTRDIAEAAGLAKGTLYEYVEDKEGILMLACEETISTIRSEIDKSISDIDDPAERLRLAIHVHLKFARKYRSAAKVLKNEMSNLGAEGRETYAKLVSSQIDLLLSILDEGVAAGRFKKHNTRISAEIFLHTCTFYFDYGDWPYHQSSLNEITDFITDNFVQAIVKGKGGAAKKRN